MSAKRESLEEFLRPVIERKHRKCQGLRKDLLGRVVDVFAESCGYDIVLSEGGERVVGHGFTMSPDGRRTILVRIREGGDGRIRKGKDGFEIDLDPEKVFDGEALDGYLEEIYRAMGRKPSVIY